MPLIHTAPPARYEALVDALQGVRLTIGMFATDADVATVASDLNRQLPRDEFPADVVRQVVDAWQIENPKPRSFPTAGSLLVQLRAIRAGEAADTEAARQGPAPRRYRPPRPEFIEQLDSTLTELAVISPGTRAMLEGIRALGRYDTAKTRKGLEYPEGHPKAGQPLGARPPRHNHLGLQREGVRGCGPGCPAWDHRALRLAAIDEVLATLPVPVEPSPLECRCPGDGWVDRADGSGCFPCPRCRPDQYNRWAGKVER